MKLLACTALAAMLVPVLATATEPSESPTLVVPGVMTTAGEKFASQCSDDSFAKATSPKRLADQCQVLLARWWEESSCQNQTTLPPGCVDTDNSKPSFLSLRGVPRHPSSSAGSSSTASGRPASR
jgi:hypothetical protein